MKKLFIFSLILFASSTAAIAQRILQISGAPPVPTSDGPVISMPGFPYMGFTDINMPLRVVDKDYSLVTLIDGNYISGSPFFIDDWRLGTILLKNGSRYTNYKLKYDSYHQEILFLRDEKGMVITDPVQEFIITDASGNPHHFINADMYGSKGKPQFYEILIDATRGHLLKANRMVVATADRIMNTKESQYLKPTEEYFYYDKGSGKAGSFGLSPNGVQHVLQLTPDQEDKLFFSRYNFNDEKDLMTFFRMYLKS